MNKGYFKYYEPKFLVLLLAILAIALYIGFAYWGITVSIISIISFFLLMLDRWLWKCKPFSYLFWIQDFSGTYEGVLEYEYRDENCQTKTGKRKHQKVIYQTASVIKISSFTFAENGEPSSPSKSIEVAVIKDEDETFSLIYTYRNEGNAKLKFPPHYGTEVIKFVESETIKKIVGEYYTNRMPQTRGQFIELLFQTNNQKTHPF